MISHVGLMLQTAGLMISQARLMLQTVELMVSKVGPMLQTVGLMSRLMISAWYQYGIPAFLSLFLNTSKNTFQQSPHIFQRQQSGDWSTPLRTDQAE